MLASRHSPNHVLVETENSLDPDDMRTALSHRIWALLILLLCCHTVVAHVAQPRPRQDDGTVTTSTNAESTASSSATGEVTSTSVSATTGTISDTATTVSSSVRSSQVSTTASAVSSSASATSTSSTNGTMFNSKCGNDMTVTTGTC